MENKIFKISFCVCLFLILQSCYHYVVNDSGYIRPPEKFKFQYEKHTEKLESKNVIDTTSIYVSEGNYIYYDSLKVVKKQYLRNNYIRFFSNGRFKQGGLQKLKDFPDDFNNIETGGIGYYLLKGNSVYLEFYSSIEAGSSQLAYAEIDADKNLKVYSGNPRSDFIPSFSKFYNPAEVKKTDIELYKKVKAENIKPIKLDW